MTMNWTFLHSNCYVITTSPSHYRVQPISPDVPRHNQWIPEVLCSRPPPPMITCSMTYKYEAVWNIVTAFNQLEFHWTLNQKMKVFAFLTTIVLGEYKFISFCSWLHWFVAQEGSGAGDFSPRPFADQEPQVSNQLAIVSNQLPQSSNQLPIVSDQVPQVSDQVPIVSNQVPIVSDQLPIVSDQVPIISDQLPIVSNQVPIVSDQLPIVSDQVPIISDQLPQVSDQVPIVSDQLPIVSDQVPIVSNQVAQMSNQMPIESNQIEQVSNQIPVQILEGSGSENWTTKNSQK